MISLLNPILAQAAAVPRELTAGGILTATMFLVTAFGSFAMIAAWVIRYAQTGHALPAARRGVLRVPWPLTVVAVVLSVLFMGLVLLSSYADPMTAVNNGANGNAATVDEAVAERGFSAGEQPGLPPDANAEKTVDGRVPRGEAGTSEATDSDSESSTTTTVDESPVPNAEGDATSANPRGTTPAQMKNALIQTIAMDLMMLLAFGVVVLVASEAGRVHLKESGDQSRQQPSRRVIESGGPGRVAGGGAGLRSPWPDLDDAASIPQRPGYDILGNRGVSDPDEAASESGANSGSASSSVSPGAPDLAEYNPFAVEPDAEQFRTGSNVTLPGMEASRIADEPFSFIRELRFAAEVFLAAYLPTTALRLIIVLISIGISGEAPESHPFLEMLEAGASVAMIAMIVIMAVFVAPIVEELQFRVVVLGGIAQLGRPLLALMVSSILFAFAHGFPDSIALLPLALALGYTYLRRRSYVTVMLVHFLFNGFNMVLALLALL